MGMINEKMYLPTSKFVMLLIVLFFVTLQVLLCHLHAFCFQLFVIFRDHHERLERFYDFLCFSAK